MELNHRTLRYLVTVADEGHFGRAADLLHVSRPALSKQIKVLETQLGLSLLDRGAHPITLTPDGAEFVIAARAVLTAAKHAMATAAAARRRRTGSLTIGFVLGFAGSLTRPILDGLAAAAPEITVELVELSFGEQVAAVSRAEVDASFARAPLPTDRRVRYEPVLTEPRCALVSARHRLAGQPSITISDLCGERQVKLADDAADTAWSDWWAADPRPDGSHPEYVAKVHTMAEFVESIAGGRAVGITTPSVGEQFSRSDVAFVPIDDIEHSELALCTRLGDRSSSVRTLRTVTRAAAGQSDIA